MATKLEKNYRIFRVEEPEKGHYCMKKITMMRIYAKDNNDAYSQLKDYIKVANKEYKYYVEAWQPHIVIRNGKKYVYDDLCDAWNNENKSDSLYKKIYDEISLVCWKYFVRIPKDIYYWFRDLCYLIKYKQTYQSSWNIDTALLDVMLHNIPILKKNKHCLSWEMLEKAILEKHKNDKKFDLKKFHEDHTQGYGEDIEKRSVELEHEMFDQLIKDIRIYKYLINDEYLLPIDSDDKDLIELDKEIRPTLPLIKGSYDSYDYKKMNDMSIKTWNRIWETVRKYGREFND